MLRTIKAVCQITSNAYADSAAIELLVSDSRVGALRRTSYVRPGKLFTANSALILEEVGILRDPVRDRLIDAVVAILRGPVHA